MKRLTAFSFLAALAIAPCAHGAVVLQDFYAPGAAGGAPTDLGGGTFGYEFNLNPVTEFSAAGHGKLVMVYSHHDGVAGNTPAHPTVTSVTYNGVALTQAVYDIDNSVLVSAGIFYLDNVATDGTLRIELSAGNVAAYAFGLYAVDGLKAGVQDTGTGRLASELTTTLPVTITTSEGFFVQEAVRNNQSLAGVLADAYLTLYDHSSSYGGGTFEALSQYQVTTAPGDYVAPIGNTGENFRRIVSAAFEAEPVPEPSAIALLGFASLVGQRQV